MTSAMKDWLALVLVLGSLILLPWAIWRYENHLEQATLPKGDHHVRVVELTGLSDKGCACWTEGRVAGWNYWWKEFPHARVTVREGDCVVLRLTSGDVSHSFSIPQLRIGPVPVEPGHLTLVDFTAGEPDSLTYNCYTVCGKRHNDMRGVLVVEPLSHPTS